MSEIAMLPYPRFSLAERERRWSSLRALMAQRDLEAIVCPAHSGHSTDFQANSRYLSHCGGGGDADITVIFPREGEVTVGANNAGQFWPATVQNWVTDVRNARRNYGNVVLERLGELNIRGKRVGITGLGRGTRTPEGTVLFHLMRRLMRQFPDTAFVDATPLLDQMRMVKSAEEIAILEESNRVVDLAFETIREHARPGVADNRVWAEATATMLREGSELPVHCNWVSGPRPQGTLTRPSRRLLERGDMIINEMEASIIGYRAQGVQPICVQTCDAEYLELMKVQGAIWHQMLEMLKPGVSVGELLIACRRICEAERPRTGPASTCESTLVMHGRGQGDDGPIVTPSAKAPYQLRRVLLENMVLIFKPEVAMEHDSHPIAWGDTVVVTPAGGKRLGHRAHGVWVA